MAKYIFLITLPLCFIIKIKPVLAEDTIITDRPDITESAVVVPNDVFQFESGTTFHWEDNEKILQLPELLFRYGIGDNFELRAGIPNYTITKASGSHKSDFGSTYLGFKYQLGPLCNKSDLALIPAFNITDKESDQSNSIDPEIKVPWSHDLNEVFSVASMGYLIWKKENNRNIEYLQTIALAQSLTEKFSIFYEYAGTFLNNRSPDHILHAGVSYLLTKDILVDLHGGFSPKRGNTSPFIAVGYSRRF